MPHTILDSEASGRVRPILLNIVMMTVSMGAALLIAEVVVRIVAPQQLILIRPDLWQPAETVGWNHRPDVAVEINTGERTVSVFTDTRGYRVGPSGAIQADRKVLLLGDSFMEALQVDYEASSAGILETEIAQEVGEQVTIHNTGVSGWDPDQYLLHARTALARDDYEVVLTAIYLGNDIIANQRDSVAPRRPVERYRLRFPRALSGSEFIEAFLRPVNDMLEVRSHLFLLFKNNLQSLRMRLGLAPLQFPPPFMASEASSPRWDVTTVIAAEIDSLARAYGADPFFILVPAAFQIDETSLATFTEGYGIDPASIDLEQPNRILARLMRERGMQVIDALPDYRQAHLDGRRLYGSVDHHFSPEGNRLFADLALPLLINALASSPDDASAPSEGGGR